MTDERRAAKEDIPPIQSHWSDDPRIKSQEHYDAVMAGEVTLESPNARWAGDGDGGEPGCYEGSSTYDRPTGYKSWRAFG